MIEIKTIASGSAGNCYLITDGKTPLLLEAGISIKEIRKGTEFTLGTVAGCLISHEHGDHSKGIQGVLNAGINTYMSTGTKEIMGLDHHRVKVIKLMEQFRIGTWTVLAFDVQHDAVEPIGFLLQNEEGEKLLFATDTYYVKYTFTGLSHIMLECNYSEQILNENIENGLVHPAMERRLLRSHFSLENVKKFLQANDLSKVQEIHLLHLSDGNSGEELFKKEVQELTGKPVYIA